MSDEISKEEKIKKKFHDLDKDMHLCLAHIDAPQARTINISEIDIDRLIKDAKDNIRKSRRKL